VIVRREVAAVGLSLLLASASAAQLAGKSVTEDAGPVSDLSTNVRDGSRPVHETGRSTHESSVGALSGNSARESSVAPMKSGTMSDISAGSVTSSRSLRRERNEARLAPAPPRMAPDGGEQPIYWEQVYDLEALAEQLEAIEPLDRAGEPGVGDSMSEEFKAAAEDGDPAAEE
jgi:hypothetical protein